MSTAHVDDETLVLLAVGESAASSPVEMHLRTCETCRAELAALRHVTGTARSIRPDDRDAPQPPAHVWDAILAEIEEPAGPTPARPPSEPTALATRRRSGRTIGLAAAAVVTAIAVSVAVLLPGRPEIVSETTLAALASDRTADARLVRSDGSLRLEIDAGELDDVEGTYYEVWLADESVEGLVSLGPLTPGEPVALPATLDPASFPVVDVSVEPLDGDPAHSGDSLWRGQLPL